MMIFRLILFIQICHLAFKLNFLRGILCYVVQICFNFKLYEWNHLM